MKNKILMMFLFYLISCQCTYVQADTIEAKPLFDAHRSGLYDMIKDLQRKRKEIYDNCIKSSDSCSNIFTAT